MHLATHFDKVCDAPYLVGCIVELAFTHEVRRTNAKLCECDDVVRVCLKQRKRKRV